MRLWSIRSLGPRVCCILQLDLALLTPKAGLYFVSRPQEGKPWQLPAEPGPPDRLPVPQPQIGTSPIATILLRLIGAVEP